MDGPESASTGKSYTTSENGIYSRMILFFNDTQCFSPPMSFRRFTNAVYASAKIEQIFDILKEIKENFSSPAAEKQPKNNKSYTRKWKIIPISFTDPFFYTTFAVSK